MGEAAGAAGASFLFASGSGDAVVPDDWARMEALMQRPPQAMAITTKGKISLSWAFIGLPSYRIGLQMPIKFGGSSPEMSFTRVFEA